MKKVYFLSDQENMGDGVTLSSMDTHLGTKQCWLSIAIPKFKEKGYEVEVIYWGDSSIIWDEKEVLIVGPIWDYYHRIKDFLLFLEHLSSLDVQIINSIDLLKFNLNKSYLRIFENSKFLPQSIFLDDLDTRSLSDVVLEYGLQGEYIMKGIVDAGATTLRKLNIDNLNLDDESFFRALQKNNKGVIIQEFLPEIRQGEFSFVFFDLKLSHSFLKIAKKGDIRVQKSHGGQSVHLDLLALTDSVQRIRTIDKSNILQQGDIKAAICGAEESLAILVNYLKGNNISLPTYARVDGIIKDGKFLLMEIEMIEPSMEIHEAEQANSGLEVVDNYVNALLNAIVQPHL